jgi:hypothetical protein
VDQHQGIAVAGAEADRGVGGRRGRAATLVREAAVASRDGGAPMLRGRRGPASVLGGGRHVPSLRVWIG